MSAISLKSITGITSITAPAGVDNQLTLHTNNTTERLKIDEAGNVRVSHTFDCVGVSTFRNNLFAQADLRIAGEIVHLSDDNTRIQFPSNDTIAFKTAGDERARITSTGKFGVGVDPTNYPGRFVVSGDALICDRDIHSRVSSGVSNSDRGFKQDIDGVEKLHLYTDNSSNIIIEGSGGSEKFRITSDGDVGIGVNDPDAKLEVLEDVYIKGSSGDGSVGIQIRSGSSALSNQHQIRTGGGTGQQIFIEALGASSAIVSKVAGTERLRIDHQGKITHTNFNGVGFTMSGSGDPTFQISDTDGTNQYVQLAHNGGDSYIVTRDNTSHGEFLVYSNNGTTTIPRIKISNDGTWTKYLNSSSTPQAAFGGTGQINGITGLPSMAGSPLVVGRDTGSLRSASFGGNLNFTSGYGIQGSEFSVYGNGNGLYLNSNVSGDAIIFQSHNGSSVGERCRIDSGGLRVNKTTTSDYGRFEVKGPTADDIETGDIRTKTVATFSGATPGTTAAGKGAGIVIKPISNRGCNYFFGVANDSTNQEAHGRFIIRSGNFASATAERLRISSSGHITPGTNNSQNIGDGTTNFASIWASTRFRGNDNVKLVLGNSQDFVIYHDGSGTNFINSPQGGSLHIKSGVSDNANLKHIQCDYNGNTIIYHQNGGSAYERIKTTNNGIEFGGEVNFTSGNNVRTFVGSFTLSDGQHADIVQNNSGYTWGFFEFYCISYHGSIGRARWVGAMSRYSNNDNYPTINNSMGYTNLLRSAGGSPSGQVNMIRVQRTGTYGNVTYNLYVRCIAPNSVPNWTGAGYATLKYDGN